MMNASLPNTTQARPDRPYSSIVHVAALTPRLYRFHDFDVLDVHGRKVGVVDWIWADEETGVGRYIGIRLQWLRGRALAIPARGMHIDPHASTVCLPYAAAVVRRAPRFAIDRSLTAQQEDAIVAHYASHPAAAPRAIGRVMAA
jgi:hypothetical protein